MFHFQNLLTNDNTLLPKNFIVVINGTEFSCVRWIVCQVSKAINIFLQKNPREEKFSFLIDECGDINMIYDILCGKSITFASNSIPFLFQVALELEIDSLMDELTKIQNKIDDVVDIIHSSSDLDVLISLEKLFLSLTKSNIEKVSSEIIEYSIDNDLLSKYFLVSCVARPENIELYVQLLVKVSEIQNIEQINSIIPVFCNILITRLKKTFYYDEDKPIQQEMCFIIQNLIELNFIDEKDVIYQRTPLFFSHIVDEKLFRALCYLERNNYSEKMLAKISENDFEEHKEMIHIGKNMNNIAFSIRNDDVESLRQSLINNNFDYSGKIVNSIYERCSFVNSNVSYIEYAAFFGSIKCFKYLLLNKANKTAKLAQFAVCGGNAEIIHICEQEGCSFQNTLQVAIKYHRWEIMKWLISTNKIEYDKINEYITKCIFFNNYKSLMTLLKIGIDPSLVLLESIRLDNLVLTNFLINLKNIDLDIKDKKERGILQAACLSGNCEIVKCILDHTKIDVNFRTLHNDTIRISKVLFIEFQLIIFFFIMFQINFLFLLWFQFFIFF